MIPSNAMEQDENYATTNVGISNTVTKGVVCGSELDVHKGEAWFYHEKIMYERALILGFYKTKKEDTGIIVPSHLDMVGTPFELQQGEIENILVDNYSNRKTYRMTRVAYGSDGRITPQTIDIQFYYKLYDEEEPFEEVMFDHENRNTKISPILSKIIASSRLVDCPPDCLGIKYAPVQALDGKEPHWTCIALADITDVVLGILAPGTVHSMNDSLGCGHFGNNGANQIELTQTAFSVIMEKCSYSIEFYPDPNHSIEFTEFTSVLSKMLFFQQICVSCGNLTSGYSLHGKMKAKPTVNAQVRHNSNYIHTKYIK